MNPRHRLSINKQCKLLSIHKSGLYYKKKPESEINLQAMEKMDKYGGDHPTSGVISMQEHLRDEGICIGRHRIRRLMRLIRYKPIYPNKSLSSKGCVKYIYPYLLRSLSIDRVNQVWAIDISYIPMAKGFMYIVAIIDVYSRKILSWDISNSLESRESLSVLSKAISLYGTPEILNSDQGVQYTSKAWTDYLLNQGIRISMDGKGRCLDNIYIERFWRTLKQEHIYLNPACDGRELYKGIKAYMEFYNAKRHHQGIGKLTPDSLYYGKRIAVA